MTIVTVNFPDRGLLGIHGVPAPCGDVCFIALGYHIIKRKDKPSRERWRGEKGEILGGAFFLDDPKINFKDCDYCGVRNVSL